MTWYPCKPTPGGPPGGRLHLQLAADPAWAQEPKFDGVRCIASVSKGWVTLTSRTGKPLLASAEVVESLRDGPTATYDCELVRRHVLWVFDAPNSLNFWAGRRALLELEPWSAAVRLVPLLEGMAGYTEALDMGAEGVVFKRRSSPYPQATRIGKLTRNWFKIKGATP